MTNLTPTNNSFDGILIKGLFLAVLVFWTAIFSTLAAKSNSEPDKDRFVKAVSRIAVLEKNRTGVPASITAAQAILESSWGQAPIAKAGNNYFGIKCKSWWKGATVHHEDDDYDDFGNLTQSCFRAYDSVEDSFKDHSDFLKSSERYAPLFELSPTDYRAWAHGLRTCGYATDKRYGDKLIAIIERLELYILDWPENEGTDMLIRLTESATPILQQKTWMDIPAEYQPTGNGHAPAIRRKEE